jgi:dipeptidyl aminopeptidase/acylaminoacyl peptidase
VNALETIPNLPEGLRKETDPADDLVFPDDLIRLDDGTVIVVLSAARETTSLYCLDGDASELRPIPGFEEVDGVWHAGQKFLCRVGSALKLVSVDGQTNDLLSLPDGASSVAVSWTDRSPSLSALVDDGPDRDPKAPVLSPSPRPSISLRVYTPSDGWHELARVPWGCRGLSQSQDGQRIAWLEPTNVIPEEAQRGQFRALDVANGQVVELTSDAGQACRVSVAPDGSGVILHANFSSNRPITTHPDLWWKPWGSETSRNLTGGGRENEGWGWLDQGSRLWVARIDGLHRQTEIVTVEGEIEPWDGSPAVLAATGGSRSAYAFTDMADYPTIVVGDRRIALPQAQSYDDLSIRTLSWKASDGLRIEGVLYERIDTPSGAPILVRAHGGPAGDVQAVRSEAVRYRHLLRAGYRVFEPAFRGSTGFGDDFLGANIGCQGDKDLDDILTGMDRLVQMGLVDADRFGIFGGSYGGYMTLRAVAVTDRFRAGVALYGFIENRRMTLETGDFTYEDEYIAPVTWPMEGDWVGCDVFSHLHEIDTPTLLLHGDRDPICTLSQSQIVYGALKHRGIDTGLVVYPGEGHGFRKPKNREDCAQRTLAWFRAYLGAKDE